MSMRAFALVRDVCPVVGVVALALFVLWQGADRRQRAEVETDAGRANVQSDVQSQRDDGVPWRLAEPREPQRTEPALEVALTAGVGISALATVFSVVFPLRKQARNRRS